MSKFSDDRWIFQHSYLGTERLHALGVICVQWNACEFGLFRLFCETIKRSYEECWALAHNVGDVALCERILTIAKLRFFPPDTLEVLDDTLKFYDACRTNRNLLVHAWFLLPSDDQENGVFARKSKSMTEMAVEPFPSSLMEVRQVADEIDHLRSRLESLEFLLNLNEKPPNILLEKFPKPTVLWKPGPQVRKEHKPPPQP